MIALHTVTFCWVLPGALTAAPAAVAAIAEDPAVQAKRVQGDRP
jgi:hypothetical protein